MSTPAILPRRLSTATRRAQMAARRNAPARVEAQGLLVRVPNPANRRSSLLELTPTGRQALDAAGTVFDRELATWLATPLGRTASTRFAKDLTTLRTAAAHRRSVQ